MIDYVGDLSRNDAELLAEFAEQGARILEFGAGASTQIFATYGRGCVECVETDARWIDKTKARLESIGLAWKVIFHPFGKLPAGKWDLIFVDGIDELRKRFALMAWERLNVGGKMLFHDTRRTKPHGLADTSDVQNVCAMIERFSPEIDSVVLNQDDSNITVVTKRAPLLYEDWNAVEGRTLEQIGLA